MAHIRRLAIVFLAAMTTSLAVPVTLWAVKANPRPVVRHQPDGTPIEVRMIGDERMVFSETPEGWTVVRDRKGWWVYADPTSHGASALAPSGVRVGKDGVPPGWRKHVRPKIDPAKFRIPWKQVDDGTVGELFRRNMGKPAGKSSPEAASLAPTNIPVLIILVEFSDWKHTTGPGTPVAGEPDYQPIAGQPNDGATWESVMGDRTVPGGLNHYYWEDSYQRFQWDVTVAKNGEGIGTVVNDGWYTNPQTMAYWGADIDPPGQTPCQTDGTNNIKDLIEWAIAAANPDVDYSVYDTDNNGTISDAELMIFVVHARQGQENYGSGCDGSDPTNEHIWSHKWNIDTAVSVDGKTVPNGKVYAIEPEFSPVFDYSVTPWTLTEKYFGVGVYAHEAFHTLGATDIYDTGYDAVPAGEWDLMDSGSYNGAKSGTHPAHIGAAMKQDIRMNADTAANSYGFILESEIIDVHPTAGIYTVEALGKGGTDATGMVHRLVMPNDTNEWLLLENRANVGYYDPYLPEHGIVIWHRDLSAAVGNNGWPYEAAVERAGWANNATGLNTSVLGAALSLEDGETELTATTDPNNARNEETASGLLDIRCVSAEGSRMSYVYGSISGPNPIFAGSAISGGTDGDAWLDAGETATLTLDVQNTSCAGEAANGVSVSLSVAADSDIPAGAVTISPASAAYGAITAGSTASQAFSVGLDCDPSQYYGRSVTFAYVISGDNFVNVTGSFTVDTAKDALFFDNAESGGTGWSAANFNPSACASATNHGSWAWQNPTHRVNGGTRAYHTPEVSADTAYTDPNETWMSPNIAIPAGFDVSELRFWQASAIPCAGKTRGRLWVSTDGGTAWTRMAFYQDGGDLTWNEQRIDLGAFAGASQIRFAFAMYTYTCWSVSPACASSSEGWYLDDISVIIDEQTTCVTCTAPTAATIDVTAPTEFAATISLTVAGDGATYNLYRAAGDASCPVGGVAIATGLTTASFPYVDTGLVAGTSYTYQIESVATNPSCTTRGNCDTAAVWGDCVDPPDAPTGLSVTAASGSTCGFDLSWTAGSANCGAGITHSIYRSTSSTFVPDASNRIVTGLSGTSYSDTGAIVPGTYYYIVRATDTSNNVEEANLTRVSGTEAAGCDSAPLAVQAFTVRSTGEATDGTGANLLEWRNPAYGTAGTTVTINYRTDTWPTGPDDSNAAVILSNRAVSFGAADSFPHEGLLVDGTVYYYAIWVRY